MLVIFFSPPSLLVILFLFCVKDTIIYIYICLKQCICVSAIRFMCIQSYNFLSYCTWSVKKYGKKFLNKEFKCTVNAGEQWNLCTFWFKNPQQILYIHSLQAKLIYLPQGFGIELGNSWIVDLVFIEYLIQSLLVQDKPPCSHLYPE